METKPRVLQTQVGGDHYAKYPIQPIEYIHANKLDFEQGNIVKLITRFRDKGGAQDLRKIKQYADILLALEYGEDTTPEPTGTVLDTAPADGVYLVMRDGLCDKFTGTNLILDCDNPVICIGVKQGDRAVVVALTDAAGGKGITLTANEDTTDYDDYDGYITKYIDAVADWSGKANTDHLRKIGLNPAINLKDGEYIPSVGEMYLIYTHRKEINAALRHVGGQEILGEWYWTSTEISAAYAWCLYLIDGNLDWHTKAHAKDRVRSVSAFNFNR